ncbi:hypothetical protein ACROYT_G034398 [Oculina patagonica]
MIPNSDWLINTFLECIQAYRLSGGEFPSFGRRLKVFICSNITSGTTPLSFHRSFAISSPSLDSCPFEDSIGRSNSAVSAKAFVAAILTTAATAEGLSLTVKEDLHLNSGWHVETFVLSLRREKKFVDLHVGKFIWQIYGELR